MRVAIRKLLLNIPSISNRIYEPSAAGPELIKPYLVIREGVQDANDPYKNFATTYEVWPFVKRETFQEVDNLSSEVISILDKKRFYVDGVPHYIEYTGSLSDDVVDDKWDALTRGLRFRVFSLAWLLTTEIEPDPVKAMKEWTSSHFADVQTNPEDWDPADETPAIYWRTSNIRSVEPTNWGAWMFVTIRGHIITPSIKRRGELLDLVVRQLALDARTRMSDNSKMYFQTVSADGGYDPFGEGQISVNVRFGILPSGLHFERIGEVTFDPNRGGVVIE